MDYLLLYLNVVLLTLKDFLSQSLFYWIIYSYQYGEVYGLPDPEEGLNPYFIGLSTLILETLLFSKRERWSLNPYFIGLSTLIRAGLGRINFNIKVSILILLDYLLL